MTNGDRVRTFDNAHLALVLMCPNDSELAEIDYAAEWDETVNCMKCVYDWLNAEEAE